MAEPGVFTGMTPSKTPKPREKYAWTAEDWAELRRQADAKIAEDRKRAKERCKSRRRA